MSENNYLRFLLFLRMHRFLVVGSYHISTQEGPVESLNIKKSAKVEMCYFVWSLQWTGDTSKLGMTPGILGINQKLIKWAFVVFPPKLS